MGFRHSAGRYTASDEAEREAERLFFHSFHDGLLLLIVCKHCAVSAQGSWITESRVQSSNPPGQAQAPSTAYAPLSAAVPAQAYPAAAVPAHAILQMSNKRPLNSPEDMGDPQLKRVRFEGSGVQNSGAPGTSAQLAGVQQTAATGSLAGVHSAAPDPSPEDFPVVEALVRREGTDKLKRVQVDGQLNAVERAEAALVCRST